MDFTDKFEPKHSLCTIKIHYHEHTSRPLLVHTLSQMNSVQVTSEHQNNIWWKHKLRNSLSCSSLWNNIQQKIYNIHYVTCNKTDTVHCEVSKYIKNIHHEMSNNLSRYFTLWLIKKYRDISAWDVQHNIKNTTVQMHNKTTRYFSVRHLINYHKMTTKISRKFTITWQTKFQDNSW
jgi:hypothetical protein